MYLKKETVLKHVRQLMCNRCMIFFGRYLRDPLRWVCETLRKLVVDDEVSQCCCIFKMILLGVQISNQTILEVWKLQAFLNKGLLPSNIKLEWIATKRINLVVFSIWWKWKKTSFRQSSKTFKNSLNYKEMFLPLKMADKSKKIEPFLKYSSRAFN